VIPELEKLVQAGDRNDHEKSALLEDAVTSDLIAQVVAHATGIPVGNLVHGERQKLLGLASKLKQRVIGQDHVADAVTDCIKQSRAGLSAHDKPQLVSLFLGPTGTGKTEMVKAIAASLFDDESAICRIDMSEYMEKHSVSRLIGAPPGYVGYEEGGTLTESVRRKPYQIVLLDEFEKAHRDVGNILLQVFDEGRLTDSQGRTVDFKNTLVIMTSNLGSDILSQGEDVEDQVMERVRGFFSPELLNRIDVVSMFNRLKREDMDRIVDIQLNALRQRLMDDRKIELNASPETIEWMATHAYSPIYGARPLKRLLQKKVMSPLADAILSGELLDDSIANITLLDDELFFEYVSKPTAD